MKEHNDSIAPKCPGHEAVSAFLDGELPPGSKDAEHIKSCPECAKLLESYRLADAAGKDALVSAVPENINARIKRRVHAKIYAEEQKTAKSRASSIFFPSFAFRMAAGLIFCAALILYTVQPGSVKKEHGKSYKQLSVQDSGAPGAVSLSDLAPVSFKEQPKPSHPLAGPNEGAVIPALLNQVWLVNDTASAESVLKEIARKNAIGKSSFARNPDGDVLKVRLELTKLQLVKFVKSCGAAGFKLLSPSAPQPEQKVFAGSPSDKINYEASFVVGGN